MKKLKVILSICLIALGISTLASCSFLNNLKKNSEEEQAFEFVVGCWHAVDPLSEKDDVKKTKEGKYEHELRIYEDKTCKFDDSKIVDIYYDSHSTSGELGAEEKAETYSFSFYIDKKEYAFSYYPNSKASNDQHYIVFDTEPKCWMLKKN